MVSDLKFCIHFLSLTGGSLFIRTRGGGNNRESEQPKGKLRALGNIQEIITQC
jgi:hypothetical protein